MIERGGSQVRHPNAQPLGQVQIAGQISTRGKEAVIGRGAVFKINGDRRPVGIHERIERGGRGRNVRGRLRDNRGRR